MNDKKTASTGLELLEVTHWRARGIHWLGMGSCKDKIVVLPEGVTHIGFKKEEVFECDNFDTQHIRCGVATYFYDAALILPSDIEEIHLPASLKSISRLAFSQLSDTVKLFVDPENPRFEVRNERLVRKKS